MTQKRIVWLQEMNFHTWYVNEIANYYHQRGGMVHCLALDMSKAFDTCLFSKLFQKMIEQGVPAIVARLLVFAYEEQKGWVRMGSYGKPLTDHIQSDWDISLFSLNNSCKKNKSKLYVFFV